MKVHPTQAQTAPAKVAQPFKRLLDEARSGPQPQAPARPVPPSLTRKQPTTPSTTLPTLSAVSTTTATTRLAAQGQRQVARQHIEAEADRLATTRSAHHQAAGERESRRLETTEDVAQRIDARAVALICQELEAALEEPPRATPGPAPASPLRDLPPPTASTSSTGAPPSDAAATRSEQALALIERIETFVQSQRPALALTLNNSLGARVEIERLGPRQVALKLVGQHGPPSAAAIAKIREELRARGLRVGALSVA